MKVKCPKSELKRSVLGKSLDATLELAAKNRYGVNVYRDRLPPRSEGRAVISILVSKDRLVTKVI